MPHYIYDNKGILSETEFPVVPGFGMHIPANGLLLDDPLNHRDGFIWVYQDNQLVHLADNRGTYYSKETGEEVNHQELGELPESLTTVAPNSPYDKWDGEQWVKDQQAENDDLAKAALEQRDQFMMQASKSIDLLQAKIKLANHNPDDDDTPEKQLLTAWETYLVNLSQIEQQPNFPQEINWPQMPQ